MNNKCGPKFDENVCADVRFPYCDEFGKCQKALSKKKELVNYSLKTLKTKNKMFCLPNVKGELGIYFKNNIFQAGNIIQ